MRNDSDPPVRNAGSAEGGMIPMVEPTPEAIAGRLEVDEQVFLFCIASGTCRGELRMMMLKRNSSLLS